MDGLMTKKLEGRVAVVTGASRGAGRGIAIELGASGATVYVTGRTTSGAPATTYGSFLAVTDLTAIPGTIDDTAREVTEAGGTGIAVRCDHTDDAEVGALFDRVARDHGRLDVLVNNAWGAHEAFDEKGFGAPFWEQPIDQWDAMFDRGVRNHVLASRAAAPMMLAEKRGLVITTTFWDRDRYLAGNLFYDLAKATMNRLAFATARELEPHGIASVALSPGFMRTELVLAHMKTDERSWQSVPALAQSETPRYVGRAAAALAADPNVMSKTGRVLVTAELAEEYGFTDVDGRRPAAFRIDRA
jgi:NAD(P)-dependent dehydrogenase (short-subunit alcohol dehydrogenase family)